ncbi:MAG: hypothetical protein WC998_01490 [Candidatus Paceibacterota bacterium]|jgi:hypothetical protein
MAIAATQHDFVLPIATEQDLKDFVLIAFGIKIPDKQICPNHSTPWRAFCDAYFGRSPVSVWEASRGFGGKSFLLALLGQVEAATLKCDVNILGGSGEQSTRVHDYMQRLWDYEDAPRYLLASDPSKIETKMIWGNKIKALMASQASVRGPHPVRLRLDEIDEMDLKILDSAMGQPMSKNGVPKQTVMSSTHQYSDGTMTEVLKRAKEKEWPVYTWCYRECLEPHGWLPESEVESKKIEVTKAMWDNEYELQEPSPEDRAIATDKVALMFMKELGEFRGGNREYIEIEPPMQVCKKCGYEKIIKEGEEENKELCPNQCTDRKGERIRLTMAIYGTGADWARKQDWTIIPTIRADCKPMKVVAFERMGREPWPVMVEKYQKRLMRYGNRSCHDATGIGDVVSGYLTIPSNGIIMVGRERTDLLSNYINAVERQEIISPFIQFMETEHRLASVDDVYGSGHLPDTISAMALAYKAISAPTGVIFI